MNIMKLTMKIFLITFLVILALFSPILLIVILFGISGGATTEYYLMMAVSYILAIVFSLLALRNKKFLFGVVFSIFTFSLAGHFIDQFWAKHNAELCVELRKNPSCIESKTGFRCDGFSTGIGICKSRL